MKVANSSFGYIASQQNPQRVLSRKYRKKFAEGFLSGLTTLLGPTDICIDCGANVGEITSILAATGATVHSFEPDPYAFSQLEKSCGQFKNVHLYNADVGVKAGAVILFRKGGFDDDPQWNSLMSSIVGDVVRNPCQIAVPVKMINLKLFIRDILRAEKQISFLKMDIEGAELEILEESVQTKVLTNIRKTAVETHPWLFDEGKERFQALQKIAAGKPEFGLNLQWY